MEPTMAEKYEVELWVAMNEDGGYSVVTDESEALTKLAEEQGGYTARVEGHVADGRARDRRNCQPSSGRNRDCRRTEIRVTL